MNAQEVGQVGGCAEGEDLLTLKSAAERLGVSHVKLSRPAKRGLVPRHQPGGRWPRVRYSEVVAAIELMQSIDHSDT